MKKIGRVILWVVLMTGLWLPGGTVARGQQAEPALTQSALAGDFVPGRLLVKFKENMVTATTAKVLTEYGMTYVSHLYASPVQLLQVPVGQELALMKQLNADPRVDYAEPDYIYRAFGAPNDPKYSKQWAHTERLQSAAAWDITTGSNAVIIAVIDTGIDETHPDLKEKIVAGYDFVEGDATPHDLNGHGTHVAGIAAALTNNSEGVAGMSWNARIMPLRVLDANGSGWSSDIISAINWTFTHGAKVLNLSLGGTGYSQSMQNAVTTATNAGSLVIAAMGNCRMAGNGCSAANPISYPAAYTDVMAVAATNRSDGYAYYSQYGAHCDIAAPGGAMSSVHDAGGIYSTMPTYDVTLTIDKDYDYLQGTSMATPYVSGLAALIWSAAPGLTPAQVQQVIQNTAVDLGPAGWDQNYGYGRIAPLAALQSVVLSAPTLSAISNPENDGAYSVSWSAVSGATGYTLQEDDNAGFSSPATRYSGAATQYQVTGQPGGTWYYRVFSLAGELQSGSSNAVSTTVAASSLSAPTLNAISNPDGDGAYAVSWSAVTGATAYRLEESASPYFEQPTMVYEGTRQQYDAVDMPGGTWYYRVRALAAGGNSPWSASRSVRVTSHVFLPLVLRSYAEMPLSLLVNGDFEAGRTGWTEYSLQGWDLIVNTDEPNMIPPHSGVWAAWLGGDDDEIATLEQTVYVPATAPYLGYWYVSGSRDVCGYDKAWVKVNATSLKTYNLCQSQATGGWVKQVLNLTAYAGQQVSLQFGALTNASLPSSFFIDDVAFQAGATVTEKPAPLEGIPAFRQ